MTKVQDKKLRNAVIKATQKYYIAKNQKKIPFKPGDRISYAARVFDNKEMENLIHATLDFWLTSGRFCKEFENSLARFLGSTYVSLVNSGSSANLLAFMALTSSRLGGRRIQKGDEVITVAAGFPTTVSPIIQYGAIPVFVDIELPAYNISISALDAALSPKTKAVFLAHTLGLPFNLSAIKDFCNKHNLWLIEDNCDALGAKYKYAGKWYYTGTIGDIGTSSFYPPHHITTGEGGAVYTNNHELKLIIDSFRDWGRDCFCDSGQDNCCGKRFSWKLGELPFGYDHKYTYSHFGYNLKMTDLQAAIGIPQLKKLPGFVKARKKNYAFLYEHLKKYEKHFVFPKVHENADPSPFGFLLTVKKDAPFQRDAIVKFLEEHNIQTRMLFAGNLIKHPCFDELRTTNSGYRIVGSLENTNLIMENTFWLGVYPGLTPPMLKYMIATIDEFIGTFAI